MEMARIIANVNCFVLNHVPFIAGQPQHKGITPILKQTM